MDGAGRSLVVFGIYMLANAAWLIVMPNLVLRWLGIEETNEPWIRLVGLLAGIVGYYYIVAARHGLRAFYPATVRGRGAAALGFFGLVALKIGPWQLLLFGVVDLLAATWTHLALRHHDAR